MESVIGSRRMAAAIDSVQGLERVTDARAIARPTRDRLRLGRADLPPVAAVCVVN